MKAIFWETGFLCVPGGHPGTERSSVVQLANVGHPLSGHPQIQVSITPNKLIAKKPYNKTNKIYINKINLLYNIIAYRELKFININY